MNFTNDTQQPVNVRCSMSTSHLPVSTARTSTLKSTFFVQNIYGFSASCVAISCTNKPKRTFIFSSTCLSLYISKKISRTSRSGRWTCLLVCFVFTFIKIHSRYELFLVFKTVIMAVNYSINRSSMSSCFYHPPLASHLTKSNKFHLSYEYRDKSFQRQIFFNL